jgi:hypothetical protein
MLPHRRSPWAEDRAGYLSANLNRAAAVERGNACYPDACALL